MENNEHIESGADMPDSSNVAELKPKTPPNPAYAVRMPSIRDAVGLAGILAEGAENPQVFDLIGQDAGDNQAALLLLFTGALRSPRSRDGLLHLLADLWTREVSPEEVESPHEEFESLTPGIPTEESWRAMSKKNRKRMVKRFEIAELPFTAIMDFGRNIAALPDVEDFLDSLSTLVRDNSGESTTASRNGTAGETGT